MLKSADVMITTALYQQQQYEVSKFLKTQPLALGILETLIAILAFNLTIWNKSFLLWSPIIFFIIGVITVLAASTSNPGLVKTSQMLSYVNFAVASISLRCHFIFVKIYFPDVYLYVLIACDILIFIFSLAIAITSCSCCCNPKSTPVMVSYVTTDLPGNHIVQMGQPDPSAVAGPVSSVMYVLPAAHGPVPPAPLPNYGPVPNAPPPIYSPVPTTPPPNYDKVSDALPPNYDPVPKVPPSAYEHED